MGFHGFSLGSIRFDSILSSLNYFLASLTKYFFWTGCHKVSNNKEKKERTYLGDVDFAFIHELDDDGQIGEAGLAHDDDGIGLGVFQEELLEVGAARRQHHLLSTPISKPKPNGKNEKKTKKKQHISMCRTGSFGVVVNPLSQI